ncbi:MAG: T9SS type A sorting domain-containing protein [Bacteroidota bacterium]
MSRNKFTQKTSTRSSTSLRTHLGKAGKIAGMILASVLLVVETSDDLVDSDLDGVVDIYDLDDDNDGIPDDLECSGLTSSGQVSVINGGFELPDANAASPSPVKTWGSGAQALLYLESDVTGWETTASDSKIEIWESGFQSKNAYEGVQFAEINANKHAALYQDIVTTPGAIMTWSFAHRGRVSSTKDDSMRLLIGPTAGPAVEIERFGTNNKSWALYKGTYTVPVGQTITRFLYESISTASGNNSTGNFIDDIRFYYSDAECPVNSDSDTLSNSLDLDSDNDGIYDIVEAGGTDADNNGLADTSTDTDGDGLVDSYDTDPTDGPDVSGCTLGVNCDLSGSTSSLFDTDSDGINDSDGDFDEDGLPNWADLDSDNDGITDSTETSEDFDEDDSPNFLDIDADGDGVVDNLEAQETSNYNSPYNVDSDSDGLDDVYDEISGFGGSGLNPVDTDGDGSKDYLDLDSDNDKEEDSVEAHDSDGDGNADSGSPANSGVPTDVDSDQDGLDDGYDNDLFTKSSTNSSKSPGDYPEDEDGSEMDFRSGGSFFPVEWLMFDGVFENNQVGLVWATATEQNSAFFEVQRSADGETYEALDKVASVGNSTTVQNYSFSDSDVRDLSGRTVLYRLKQVDFNGTFDYSKRVEVTVGMVDGQTDLNVYPNPSSGMIYIKMEHPESLSTSAVWQVLDISGRILKRGTLDMEGPAHQVDLSRLPGGMYIVTVQTGQDRYSKQVVKK